MLTTLIRQLSSLKQLQSLTSISIDTSDLSQIQKFAASDATTNPSLILAAIKNPASLELVNKTLSSYKGKRITSVVMNEITDSLSVELGTQISKLVPGYISTEVDPRLSFNPTGTVKRAEKLIEMYKQKGVSSDRVLIKIASTWEGIQASKILQAKGINCNMTLIFNKAQAIACAEAGAKLISPFVGRILDWYKKNTGKEYLPHEDPGVKSVSEIYAYYKKYQIGTLVMGASFRNVGEVLELAGCDKLTISPSLLEELEASTSEVVQKLKPDMNAGSKEPKMTQRRFRWAMNEDPMATEKLSEGIRKFTEDTVSLHKFIRKQLKKLPEIQTPQ